jgi:ElaB/YqjD/DUF883 family membrane-anchored ribosome-binding protein
MGKDSSEIRREIEQTRGRMGDTVEALSYKADVPARVKDAVHDKVENVRGTIGEMVGTVKDTVVDATGRVGTALGGAKRTLSETTGSMAGATSDMKEKMSSVTTSMSERVGELTGNIPSGDDVKNVARRGIGIARENPLGLALGALAVGFLAGLAAPVSDLEREKIGPLRDDLVEKAQSLGSDALEHGKQIVQETAQAALKTAQDSAQSHGDAVLSEARGGTQHGAGDGTASV